MTDIPIVILHGWNLSREKYYSLEKALQTKGFNKVYSLDLPGFGKNKDILQTPFTLADYGKYVIDFFNEKKIDSTAVIGHSFGGRIGIYLSVNFPSRINALVLSGTPGLGADLTLKEKVYLSIAKGGKTLFKYPPMSSFSNSVKKILYKLVGSYDYYNSRGVLRETFKNIVNYRLGPLLGKIEVPTLLIWGSEDKIVPVRIAHAMNKEINNSKLVVFRQARHAIPWTHAEDFAGQVEFFLKNK